MAHDASGAPAEPQSYVIGAVDRTLSVLTAMARLGPATLVDLAAASGCTTVNAFRILRTLEARGFAAQDGQRGAWRLGTGLLPLARAATQLGLPQIAAAPVMTALTRSCGEPVVLAVRDGEQGEVLAVQSGARTARLFASPGDRAPLHAGPGRLLLAYAPLAIQTAVLTSRLPRLGAGSRTDPAWIAADLPRIRSRSWLITTGEIADDAVTVSAAVRDGAGAVVAVLSIASPALRMRPPRPHALLTPLVAAAEATGSAFGG